MNVFSFCRRCSWIISWLDSYIFISDATAPKTLMLAFCRQSHMQEPRPARPECPACSRAPGSGQWVWERGSGGAHTARRAGGWFGPFLCLLRKKEGKKSPPSETNPSTNSAPGCIFTGSEPDVLLAVRAFSALDPKLLTKQSRVAAAPCPAPTPAPAPAPAPVSAPTTAGDMAHPEEGPPDRTPGPLETPWRCSFGYPNGVGRRSPAVEPSPCLSHPAGHPLQQAATGCGLKPLAHPSIQLEFNDTLMVYCIYLYVSF